MITFFLAILFLLLGYFVYGTLVEKVFGIQPKRTTPAIDCNDGVDFVPMSWGKIFLIQFLNIAGLGPIFGAIAGAMWGPVAFLWIVLGNIFAGAVHDYFAGMLSLRNGGQSLPEIVGHYMGNGFKQFMRGFTVLLLILVGVVFVLGPAGILVGFDILNLDISVWVIIIFIYYLFATLLPIDKIIGRFYPLFGAALLFMALGIIISLLAHGYTIPELTLNSFSNAHYGRHQFPIFPMLFVTIACGAISGFHATQSPLMARCIANEKLGKRVFYGAMVTEGVVALIWAAVAMSFFGSVADLNTTMQVQNGNAAWVVNEISNSLLGQVGGILAVLGVVFAPITSGDTAFRSARLIISDFTGLNQKSLRNRLIISIPLFIVGVMMVQIDFSIIWRYFAWSNQTLATIVLWASSIYLAREQKFYWITVVPATFMTAVVVTYVMVAPEGLNLPNIMGYYTGMIFAIGILILFHYFALPKRSGKKLGHLK